MSVRFGKCAAAPICVFLFLFASSCVCQANDLEPAEVYYFFDESQAVDQQSAQAIRAATESGFRIREIAANRFPNLLKRFQIRRLPSLVLLRRSRLEGRHEGRFTFSRIREMFARAREKRMERRERFREMLVGNGQIRRSNAPVSIPPLAPRSTESGTVGPRMVEPQYIPTSSSTAEANLGLGRVVPKPLDRNGRFAVAHNASPAEMAAFEATVRLRVVDPSGTSHGTGTIIHASGNDALVLTCGHIFRESRGQGRIEADISFSSQKKTVNGRLISYDSNAHDIALLTIRTPYPVTAARIARSDFRGRLNEDVFTIGCDKGRQPTIRRSHFKRAATYDGTEKYDVFGRPIDGRSGGGLFNQRGELIGVCNAAAVHVDEGIYSGLKTIYRQLGISHLEHLFNTNYWNERSGKEQIASQSNRLNSFGSTQSRSTAVQFQALPANPAIAFQAANAQRSPVESTRSSRGMVPVNRQGIATANASVQQFSPSRGNGMNTVGQNQSAPRIPSFHLADRL